MVSPMSSRRMKAPISRFSSTDSDTKTLRFCGTKPMPRGTRACGARAVMSSPSRVTLPRRRSSMPKMAFMAVDLPAPLGPTTTAISPRSTVISQSSMMSAPP